MVLLFFIGNFLFNARIVKEIYEFMDKFSVKGGCGIEVFVERLIKTVMF